MTYSEVMRKYVLLDSGAGGQILNGTGTVSYTHLDVYKRQILLRLRPPAGKTLLEYFSQPVPEIGMGNFNESQGALSQSTSL